MSSAPLSSLPVGAATGLWLTTRQIVDYSFAAVVIAAAGYYWFVIRARERAILAKERPSAASPHSTGPAFLSRVLQGGSSSIQSSPGGWQSRQAVRPRVGPFPEELLMSVEERQDKESADQPERWVSLRVRQQLDYGKYQFKLSESKGDYESPTPPDWLNFNRLDSCSRRIEHPDYLSRSEEAKVTRAGAFGPLSYANRTIVHGYAARIEVAEILGTALPGAFLAMPGPFDLSRAHPFLKVLKDEKVGLLCRLQRLGYCDQEFWTKHPSKPDELAFPTDWPNCTFPPDDLFEQFVCDFEIMADGCFARGQRVAIHCLGGVGRTGTLIAAYLIKKQVDSGVHPDPWGLILELRKRRRRFVLDETQLAGLYRFAKHMLERRRVIGDGRSVCEGSSADGALRTEGAAHHPSGWVPLSRREALNYEKYTFAFTQESLLAVEADRPAIPRVTLSAPDWLSFEGLNNCSRSSFYDEYVPNSGQPIGAVAGADELLFAERACVHGYAAKIAVAEILGTTHPGTFLAMPAPKELSLQGDDHPFMKVLNDERVGLLCRLSEKTRYFEESFWEECASMLHELPFPERDWPSHSFPEDELFEQYVYQFEQMADACFAQGGSVAVHCRAGVGRTGTLIAAYLIKKQLDSGVHPDPWGLILELRQYRRGFVSNEVQLAGLYRFAKRLLAKRHEAESFTI
jgi:protein-tyrosine phosphatase